VALREGRKPPIEKRGENRDEGADAKSAAVEAPGGLNKIKPGLVEEWTG
jgi:hypothetical protein